MMASKDNKCKYDHREVEVEVSMMPMKKERMNGDDNGDNANDNSSSSTDDFSSELEEEVSSEEEMNLPSDSDEKLFIWRGRANNNYFTRNNRETSDDGSDSDISDDEDQFSDKDFD
jgi:hypothetical protein